MGEPEPASSVAGGPGPLDAATSTNHEDGHEVLRLRGGGEEEEEWGEWPDEDEENVALP